eukprot:365413-Chlamydomonas_euryale.AAC.10
MRAARRGRRHVWDAPWRSPPPLRERVQGMASRDRGRRATTLERGPRNENRGPRLKTRPCSSRTSSSGRDPRAVWPPAPRQSRRGGRCRSAAVARRCGGGSALRPRPDECCSLGGSSSSLTITTHQPAT